MEVIGKTSKRIRRVIDTEINELMKWAGQQSPQENEFTMSAWIPRHLRGLMKFVNDLRLGEGKSSQNGRRMQEEISKIDKAISKGLTPYDRKKYIAKVTYMRILGVEAAVGYQEGLRLMASDSIWDKQVGYLYISLVFDNQPEMQRLVVQCLLDDLRQEAYSHPYVHQLALTLVAHFRNAEIAHHIAPTLEKFLCSLDSITGTQQSVCLCQEVLASIDPEGGVSNGKWFQVIFTWLDSGSCDTVKNILSLIKTLLTVRYNEFAVCIPQLLVFFQESVRRLPQYSSGAGNFSRVSPAAFVELMDIFEAAPLIYDEEVVLMDAVRSLLLHFATTRDPPRYKKLTDSVEAEYTDQPMFGVNYEWLKRSPSYRQESVVFPVLRLVFRRESNLDLMKEGLDYYARYIRDRRLMVRRCALDQVMTISGSERGFALLKSSERWSIAILVERMKDEVCADIRNDICTLCFLLTVTEEEANVLCQNVLDYLKKHLNGLGVRRLSEHVMQVHNCSLLSFQKLVYVIIELTDYAANQVSGKSHNLCISGILRPEIPVALASSICLLLEDKISRNSADPMIQLAVIILGGLQDRNSVVSKSSLDNIIQLFCDLSERPGLSTTTKAYLSLYLALFGAQIGSLPLRSKIIQTIRRLLDKPKASKEYQAYQSFMLLNDNFVSPEAQLQALRFIAASVDKGVEATSTVRVRPRPSTIQLHDRSGPVHACSSFESDAASVMPRPEGRTIISPISSFNEESSGVRQISAIHAGGAAPFTAFEEELAARNIERSWSSSISSPEVTSLYPAPWTPSGVLNSWSDTSAAADPFAMPVWSPSSVMDAVVERRQSDTAGSEWDLWSNSPMPNYGTDSEPKPAPQQQHFLPQRESSFLFTIEFDPMISLRTSSETSPPRDTNLMDLDTVVAARANGPHGLPSFLPTVAGIDPVLFPPALPARPAPGLSKTPNSTYDPPQETPVKSGWTFNNPWHQFDLSSVVQHLNIGSGSGNKQPDRQPK